MTTPFDNPEKRFTPRYSWEVKDVPIVKQEMEKLYLTHAINLIGGKSLLEKTLEQMEKQYFDFYELSSSIQEKLWEESRQGKRLEEYRAYIEDLMHETNLHASTVINTIRNYHWYKKEKPDKVSGAGDALFHRYLNFLRFLQSMQLFYDTIYKPLQWKSK